MVVPLIKMVNSTTPTETSKIWCRSKGATASFCETARASASETAPRRPPHAISVLSDVVMPSESRVLMGWVAKTNTKRIAMMPTQASTIRTKSLISAVLIAGAMASPTKKKIKVLAM